MMPGDREPPGKEEAGATPDAGPRHRQLTSPHHKTESHPHRKGLAEVDGGRYGHGTAAKRVPKAARPETVRQAERWDVNKNRAVEAGLCHPCAAQYAWGLQDGFTGSRPPCLSCSEVVADTIGAVKPNGWRVLPSSPRHRDIRERPGGPHSRHMTPGMGRDGYGSCRVCDDHWSGFAVCHCAGCHHTFADIRAFDQHRVRGRCQDPAARGLVKIQRAHWVGWALATGTPDGCA